MVNFKKSLLIAALLSVASSVLAAGADTASLKVTGNITPGSCSITLDNGGVADFGTHFAANLNQTESTTLGSRIINMNIECGSDMSVAWSVRDEKMGTGVDLDFENAHWKEGENVLGFYSFGFGLLNEIKIGGYMIVIDPSKAVATTSAGLKLSKVGLKAAPGNGWDDASISTYAMMIGDKLLQYRKHSFLNDKTIAAFKSASVPLKITAAVRAANELNLTEEVYLDGEATIRLVYL